MLTQRLNGDSAHVVNQSYGNPVSWNCAHHGHDSIAGSGLEHLGVHLVSARASAAGRVIQEHFLQSNMNAWVVTLCWFSWVTYVAC